MREMPKYTCHKIVQALKIAGIELDADKARAENRETDGSMIITPAEEGYVPVRVDHEYMRKYKPQVGGYYVVYEDGYKSWSPADVFEVEYALASMESTLGTSMKAAATMLNAIADQLDHSSSDDEGKVLYERDTYLSIVAQLSEVLYKLGTEVELAIL